MKGLQASGMKPATSATLHVMPTAAAPSPEPYVGPDEAAAFLCIPRLTAIRMARAGKLPAHPMGDGRRRMWRFKLSELDRHMQQSGITSAIPPVRQ